MKGIAGGSQFRIRKGTYELKIRHPASEENSIAVHVLPTETALDLNLRHKTGTLAISCNVEDAVVTIGATRYVLPTEPVVLEIGEHEIAVEKEDFMRVRRVVTTNHSRSTTLNAYLLSSCCDISAAIISRILLLCWRR